MDEVLQESSIAFLFKERMRTVKILLTCLGGRFMLDTLMALRLASSFRLEIFGSDSDFTNAILFKDYIRKFYKVPRGSQEGYIDAIMHICKNEGINLVIAGSDEEVYSLAKHKTIFDAAGIIVTVDNFYTVSLLRDKWELFTYLESAGLRMPRFYRLRNSKDLMKVAEYFEYPKRKFVLKPRISRGARNVWIVGKGPGAHTLREVCNYFFEQKIVVSNYIATEFLPGNAYDVDLLSRDGNPICIVSRRRIWKNPLSSFSEGCIIEKNERVINLVKKIATLLKINYLYDFDCGEFADSTPAVYEINPRASGAVASALGGGVNMPLLLVQMALGMKLPRIKLKFGVEMFPITKMVFLRQNRRILCRYT